MNKLRLWRLAIGSVMLVLPVAVMAAAAPSNVAAATPQSAQSTVGTSSGIGQGLEISPPLLQLSADPGQTITATIRLRNVTPAAVVVKSEADDFAAKDEQGDPQIILNPAETSTYSLRNWIAPLPDMSLAPGEVKTSTVVIHVPPNGEPGGHYGVVRFTAVPPSLQGQTGVSLSASIGALILLKVNGKITEQMSFADFFTSQNGHRRSWFETGPITFTERLKNTGNLHEQPTGSIKITNLLGHTVATLQVNGQQRNVLPASIRRFDQSWQKNWLIGRFRARANLTYGADHRALASQSIIFWVVPYKFVVLALALLILLIVIIWVSLRRYKTRILRQAQRPR